MATSISIISNQYLIAETFEAIQALTNKKLALPDTEEKPTLEELVERTGNSEAVLVGLSAEITKEYLDACPSVKYIGVLGSSMANIDIEAVKEKSIILKNATHYGDEPTGEYIFMQLISLARGIGDYQWKSEPCELYGKSIGIIGPGAVGTPIAKLAKAFHMDVSYFGTSKKAELDEAEIKFKSKKELLKDSDIIVLTPPSNTQVLADEDFAIMKSNSILVSISMGNPFDRASFLKWIAKDDNFAILDMASGIENYKIYSQLPNVVFPKVIAGHSYETKQRLGRQVVANLKKYLDGNQVNI